MNYRRKVKSAVPGGGGGGEAVVMLLLLLAFWPKYLSGILFHCNTTTSSLSGIE